MQPNTQTTQLKDIQQITRNFVTLQGLVNLPIGFLLLFNGFNLLHRGSSEGSNLTGWAASLSEASRFASHELGLVLIFLVIALFFAIRFYYRNRFGVIKPLEADEREMKLTGIGFGILFLLTAVIDLSAQVPIPLIGLVFAAAWGVRAWRVPFHRAAYVAFSLASLITTFIGSTIGFADHEARFGFVMMLNGMQLAAAGLLDHSLLLKYFKTVGLNRE